MTNPPPDPSEPIDAEIVEPVSDGEVVPPAADYDEHGVPTLDYVRNKIESRYTTSLGSGELARETPEARTLEEQEAERERAAAAKLEEIRRTLDK
jgi:phage shock protein A